MSNVGYVPVQPTASNGTIVAGQNISVSGAAVSLGTFNSATNLVVTQIQGGDVYATFDGTTPSTTTGFVLFKDKAYNWNIQTAKAAKFLQYSVPARVQCQEFVTSLEQTNLNNADVVQTK